MGIKETEISVSIVHGSKFFAEGGNVLVVIDGQNDFILETGKLFVAGISGELSNYEIIDKINDLAILPYDFIITTEDMHPQEHIEFQKFGEHCLVDSFGQKYHEQLMGVWIIAYENLVKGMDSAVESYSVCTSPDFVEHIKMLKEVGVKRVFLCGWAYTHCVGESAISYADEGFEVYVIRDATRSVPPPYGEPEEMDNES